MYSFYCSAPKMCIFDSAPRPFNSSTLDCRISKLDFRYRFVKKKASFHVSNLTFNLSTLIPIRMNAIGAKGVRKAQTDIQKPARIGFGVQSSTVKVVVLTKVGNVSGIGHQSKTLGQFNLSGQPTH